MDAAGNNRTLTGSRERADFIKAAAHRLGFSFCGISKAEFLGDEAPRLEAWLRSGRHGKMTYLENYFDKRLDPSLLVPGAKSVVSLGFNYFPDKEVAGKTRCVLSAFARLQHPRRLHP